MTIAADISPLRDALIQDHALVSTDRNGGWDTIGGLKSKLATLDCFEEARLCNLAKSLVREFDRLEKIPVKRNEIAAQIKTYTEYLESAKFVATQMKKFLTAKKVKKQFGNLCQRMIAMQYRIEGQNGGINKQEESVKLLTKLQESVIKWKEKYPLYQNTGLTQSEIQKLREATQYPEFSKLLLFDPIICNLFFRWAIRDNNSVESFVEFPSTCDRLKAALLSGRVGLFGNSFQFVNWINDEKVMALPIQIEEDGGEITTKNISILDENARVRLPGAYELTIRNIIDIFARKNTDPGNLEFFKSCGITNWHGHELGRYDPQADNYDRVNLDEENGDWWLRMPIFESLTLGQVKERYGIDNLTNGQWVAVAASTRESISMDIDRSHGFFNLLPYDKKEEKYHVLPIGKFAEHFPSSVLEKALFLTNTVESRLQYPDENSFYSHRQQAMVPFVLSEQQGRELMETVRKDLISSRKGKMIFQFAGENCAGWPQERLEELLDPKEEADSSARSPVPNLFAAPVLDSRPSIQPIKAIFSVCRLLPQCVHNTVLKIVAFILGSWRGMFVEKDGERVFKSMRNSQFRINCEMYHPAVLHKRVQNNEIKGKVIFGHHLAEQNLNLGT